MKRALAVAWRDLKRAAGAPVGIILMLLVPLLLTGIMGLSFGSRQRPARVPRLRLLVLDRDGAFISQFITSGLRQERLTEFVDPVFVGEEGVDLIRKGKASALLIIPAGFSDSVLTGRRTFLELVKNPGERFLPVVAEHGVRLLATGLDAVALLLEDELAAIS
ncbi:MAG: ABC transporter permease, partial [Candidatus Eisenbacteria bacterium]|nr:ABC transporter permease [Candidatus Eisenbacteria bacterium]